MNQQKPKLQDLTEQAAGLLTFDLCQQYDPAHNLREECREVEERWDKLEERLIAAGVTRSGGYGEYSAVFSQCTGIM